MDHLHERFEALEHHVQSLHHQTRTVTRRLRWGRGTALLLLGLGLISWPLQSAITQAQEEMGTQAPTLEQRAPPRMKIPLGYFRVRVRTGQEPISGKICLILNG